MVKPSRQRFFPTIWNAVFWFFSFLVSCATVVLCFLDRILSRKPQMRANKTIGNAKISIGCESPSLAESFCRRDRYLRFFWVGFISVHPSNLRHLRSCLFSVPLWLCGSLLQAQNTTDATKNYHNENRRMDVSFSKQVAPIFQSKCVGCHSKTATMGGFVLSDFESLMKGGGHGKAIVPGKSAESRLVQMIEGTVQPRMPMSGELEAQEIATIKTWIDQGAKLDQDVGQLQTLHEPEIPKIKPASLSAQIGSIAFSPDGSLIAAGGYGEVTLFEAATRKAVGKISGLTEAVRSLAFSLDGRYFATGAGRPAQEGEIQIWQTGKEFWAKPAAYSFKAHRDCVYALAFSPDSKLLASTSYDHMIYLWDPATGKQVKPLKEHTDSVFDLAFSPNGKWLASGGADRTVKLWDVASGKRIHTLGSSTEGVNTLAFHPNGRSVAASGSDRTIRVWDISGNEPQEIHSVIAHEEAILRLAYSPDGNWLVSTGWDKLAKIWDTKTMEQKQVISDQSDWVLCLSFSPDGKKLLFGRYDGSVSVYDTANYQLIGNLLEPPSTLRAEK
jgi:WD40 repeat protein